MTLLEAQVLALKVLKQVMEEKLDHNNVQLAQVRSPVSELTFRKGADEERQVVPDKGFSIMNAEELKEVITRTEA